MSRFLKLNPTKNLCIHEPNPTHGTFYLTQPNPSPILGRLKLFHKASATLRCIATVMTAPMPLTLPAVMTATKSRQAKKSQSPPLIFMR